MKPFAASARSASAAWRLLAAAFALSLLGACSPAYDWREIRVGEDGYVAMMPDKPARMTRPINLDGMMVSMTMQGARVDELSYTVGEVALPDETLETRERAVAAMRTAMVRNINGTESSAEALAVPVVDRAGRRVGTAPGWRIEAAGRAYDKPVVMLALFAARGDHAWQAVVLGPEPDREQASQFFEGFKLVE
jgi:hypothetical protein